MRMRLLELLGCCGGNPGRLLPADAMHGLRLLPLCLDRLRWLRVRAHTMWWAVVAPGIQYFGLGHQPDQEHELCVPIQSCIQPGHFTLGHLSGMRGRRQCCDGGTDTRRKSRISPPLPPLVPRCVAQRADSTTHARLALR